MLATTVTRWYIFIPKIPICVNILKGPGVEDVGIFYVHLDYLLIIWYIFWPFWYILWPFGIFYGHLVYFVVIGFIFHRFGLFY
jgi:hypothetical protein